MKSYEITLAAKTPLLMHADNIEWADQMERWKNDPASRKVSKAGDDRSPAFRWIGSLYHDGERIAIPSDNIMCCLMEGGAMVPVPGGKSGKTFKSQTQSGMVTAEAFWSLLVGGKPLPAKPILALAAEPDFQKHQDYAASAGFMLYVKRARIGQSKHIRVRPRFDAWSVSGVLNVMDDQITHPILEQILYQAGQYKGLCDWRPGGGKKPGPWGMFTANVKAL